MPRKSRSDPRDREPLPRCDFDRFRTEEFAPLVQEVRSLRYDFLQSQKSAEQGQQTAEARHREIRKTLDALVKMFRGLQDKTTVQDVRIADLNQRVTLLETR